MNIIPQLLVAGTNSGCGKTTFTLGLLRSLARRGYDLASFKCGPDYIDPKFHALASGKPSINLDLFMTVTLARLLLVSWKALWGFMMEVKRCKVHLPKWL